MRTQVRSLASLSGLRIRRGRELRCRSQMRLGSRVAVAVVQASSCSSLIQPLAWEPPYAACVALKSKKKKERVHNTPDGSREDPSRSCRFTACGYRGKQAQKHKRLFLLLSPCSLSSRRVLLKSSKAENAHPRRPGESSSGPGSALPSGRPGRTVLCTGPHPPPREGWFRADLQPRAFPWVPIFFGCACSMKKFSGQGACTTAVTTPGP